MKACGRLGWPKKKDAHEQATAREKVGAVKNNFLKERELIISWWEERNVKRLLGNNNPT